MYITGSIMYELFLCIHIGLPTIAKDWLSMLN